MPGSEASASSTAASSTARSIRHGRRPTSRALKAKVKATTQTSELTVSQSAQATPAALGTGCHV